jgi:hypothetical protein
MPTADEFSKAIVAACRLTGENPLEIYSARTLRARHYALDALLTVFPDVPQASLSRCVGYPKPKAGTANLYLSKRTSWWRDTFSDEVVCALVEKQFVKKHGDQAK